MNKVESPALSRRVTGVRDSGIDAIGRLCQGRNVINLAQGVPEMPAPETVKEAAVSAIRADLNQYAIPWGADSMRGALAERYLHLYGLEVDPVRELTICCGATEAILAAMLAVVDSGDEVVLFEPFYESHLAVALLAGAVPRFVRLREPGWRFDPRELAAAFNSRTRAVIVNSPSNPTGKIFDQDELSSIAALCRKWNVTAIADEVYELIVYDGRQHLPLASLADMHELTITVSSTSKTYSVTGWRVGWAMACRRMTEAIRKVHTYAALGTAAPLQEAAAAALRLTRPYYRKLSEDYHRRREILAAGLDDAGLSYAPPEGGFFFVVDISPLGFQNASAFVHHLVETVGVAALPAECFYARRESGAQRVRFAFCQTEARLNEAASRLAKLSSASPPPEAPSPA